jgi:hypothetical protein
MDFDLIGFGFRRRWMRLGQPIKESRSAFPAIGGAKP